MNPNYATYRHFTAAKTGYRADQNEDAVAVSALTQWPVRVALSDGATETAFSRSWAQLLASAYVHAGFEGWHLNLAELQQQWQDYIQPALQQAPWYLEAKAAQGAGATALGLTLHASRTFNAYAIGDCCLAHMRPTGVPRWWPVASAAAFGSQPGLLMSHEEAASPMRALCGTWQPGDAFLLASDAVAAWLMQRGAVHEVLDWDAKQFAEATGSALQCGALRDDDLTLQILYLPITG